MGRNNHDIDDYLNTELYFDRTKEEKKLRSLIFTPLNTLKLSYCTVHSSKGLEDDYVIVLNANNSKLGFPNKMEDDELLNLVLGAESNYEYAEERRLWYVALTRTKSYTFIIANKNSPSIFLDEIISSCEIINTGEEKEKSSSIECPDCKKGRLVMKVNGTKKSKFYGCSNYPYCKYTINDLEAVKRNKRCPKCGDFLVYRNGKFGGFLSCKSFPNCTYAENYTKQN